MRLMILLLLTMLSVGCATMARGGRQEVRIETQPAHATITVNGQHHASPAQLELDRKQTYRVLVAADGYQPVEFELKAKWDGLVLASLALPLGSVWTATDTASGADKAFAKMQTIVLKPAPAYTGTPLAPLKLNEFFGYLLTDQEYAEAKERQRDNASMDWRNN